ncbi:MAG TPA: hypothetical protein EYO51_04960 [Methylococcaceae bacterium]|jgi:hypothetical protein|nr:hypothetical protein [Methylococcaceae bacterium]HIA45814.1 hypothetical protein [Methylococcaceae bacterium]HIB62482.1 hypothetical protein [Methylococcaceae bacterium]HIN69385.1 hypothetical protein [Methylococcales bacterium]HIO45212.1 hypothetical protein [Methylococcales bacterium]
MKTARSHLYQYDVSIEDAYHFVYSNLNNPQIIYDTCLAYGVTNSMLAEIVNTEMPRVTKAQVIDFFSSYEIDSNDLDATAMSVPIVSYSTPDFNVLSHSDSGFDWFNRKIDVFGIPIYAAPAVGEDKLLHAANIMAQWLDNNEDGLIDNQGVLDNLIVNKASVALWVEDTDTDLITEGMQQFMMDLGSEETRPEWHLNGHTGQFDASLEELWHLITQSGYANLYPEVFGEKVGSSVANAMDIARGGQFVEIPDQYPESAWYSYGDPTCDYACMITEYMYWGMTSILGAQENRAISDEWKLNTKDLVQSTDPAIYDLLTDPQYNFPTVLPDGSYNFIG